MEECGVTSNLEHTPLPNNCNNDILMDKFDKDEITKKVVNN